MEETLHKEHRDLLDSRYANRQVPRFDSSKEGIENMALRAISDYYLSPSPAVALGNVTAWILRAIQIGRLEQQAADRETVGRHFDEQARNLSEKMRLSS